MKRYYEINFTLGRLVIKKDVNLISDNDCQFIAFRDIKSCYLMTNEEEMKKICSKTFNMPFCLHTSDRTFILFATREQERQLWLDGFDYVI